MAATAMFFGLAVFSTYYRFFFHSADYNGFPMIEFWSTIAMIGGGVVRTTTYHERLLAWSLAALQQSRGVLDCGRIRPCMSRDNYKQCCDGAVTCGAWCSSTRAEHSGRARR